MKSLKWIILKEKKHLSIHLHIYYIVQVDLLGLEKLTSAFGVLTCIRGLAAFLGPPVAGFVVDMSKELIPMNQTGIIGNLNLDRWMDRKIDWPPQKIDDLNLDRWIDRKKDRQIDTQIDRKKERQIDRQIDGWLNRQIDRLAPSSRLRPRHVYRIALVTNQPKGNDQ